MKKIEPWFGRWGDEDGFFYVVSVEFELDPPITTLAELESFLRRGDGFDIAIRYADEPYGRAGELVREMLSLFDRLKEELGEDRFTYRLLPREEVLLDFSKQKYVWDLWEEIAQKLDCAYYGRNLDALWDVLTGMPHKGDDFIILRPRQYREIPYGENEGFTEYVDKICSIFQKAEQERYLTLEIQYTDEPEPDLSVYQV